MAGWQSGDAADEGDASGFFSSDFDSMGGGDTAVSSGFGGGGSGCRTCGENGHYARECPNKPAMTCRKCNEEGHMARDCPNAPSGGDRNCFNCGQPGHMKDDCPEPPKERVCRRCNEEGHFARECPNAAADTRGCFNCGQPGHMRSDCPEPQKERAPMVCRNCQQEGHKSVDCTNEPVERLGEDGQPIPKAQTYVPKIDTFNDMLSELCYLNGNIQRFDEDKVTVSDAEFAVPLQSFEEAGLCPTLLERISALGYSTPTPIQRFAIPVVMRGKDLIACSQTGSGKSAAFILPILQNIMNDESGAVPDRASISGKKKQKPLVIVISPTRELCRQLSDHFRVLSEEMSRRIGIAHAYGGTKVEWNRSDILCGTHVLCAVPGRLKQFVEEGIISFENLRYLVLDEADRMLDQGFEQDIRYFTSHESMPPSEARQTLMFSATFPPEVEQLARQLMRSSQVVKVVVGTLGGVNTDVSQSFIKTKDFPEKREELLKILEDYPTVRKDADCEPAERDRILVFVEQKKKSDMLAIFLNLNGFDSTTMHGDRSQEQREEALKDLKQGKFPVLVATAVASRGLDIKGLSLVVNFDLPKEIDDYVHRVGRTGRVGRPGKAISFFTPEADSALAPALVQALNECGQPVPDFVSECASGESFGDEFQVDDDANGGWGAVDNTGWNTD